MSSDELMLLDLVLRLALMDTLDLVRQVEIRGVTLADECRALAQLAVPGVPVRPLSAKSNSLRAVDE